MWAQSSLQIILCHVSQIWKQKKNVQSTTTHKQTKKCEDGNVLCSREGAQANKYKHEIWIDALRRGWVSCDEQISAQSKPR